MCIHVFPIQKKVSSTHTCLQHLNEEHKNLSKKAADYSSPTEVSSGSHQAAFLLHLSFQFVRFECSADLPNTDSSTDLCLLCT